jgi:dipeptidyl aminopeptidase/acylaminoacyl peptidase
MESQRIVARQFPVSDHCDRGGMIGQGANHVRLTGIFFIGTILACSAEVALAQSQKIIPIEQFTKYDEFGDIKLSPSGEHAAYMTGKYGRSAVAVISMKDRKITGGGRVPDGFEVYDFDWVSNTRLVYQIAERQPGMAKPSPTGEMGAIDIDNKNNKFIYGYRAGEQTTGTHLKVREASYATPEIIEPLLADQKNILIAEYPWKEGASAWHDDPDAKPLITRLNVYTGEKHSLGRAPLAGATLLADHNEQVRFAIGLNDHFKLTVLWKPDPKGDWTAFELPGFQDQSVIPRLLTEDNRSVIFTGTRDKESLVALYSLDLTTKEISKLYGFEKTDVASVIMDFAGRNVVGVVSYLDKPLVHWLNEDDRSAKLYRALSRAFPNQTVEIASATRDGRIAVVSVSSDVNPGDYYLFDTQTMKADYLQAASKWIDPAAMRPKEPFSMKARDGVELHGYVTQPAGTGPFPLVVLPHGGPHGVRDYWDYDWEVQLLANRGYAVLQVNFRGSGGFGDEFEESGFGNWGASMQDDVTDATQWTIEKKIASAERICIFGASYGGYAALQGAVREPKLYKCAIGYAGIYDLELMLSSADIPRSKSGREYLRQALGDDRNRMHAYSPVYNADKIQVPVLLIHGKEDGRADFEQAKRMKAALVKNNKQLEWMALSREGHGVYDEETRREVYERIIAFLDRNLKNGAAAKPN